MKKIYFSFICFLFLWSFASGQNTQISPSNLQLAQLTYDQIKAISSPAKGMMNYDITFNCVRVFDGNTWKSVDFNSNNNSLKVGYKLGEANSGTNSNAKVINMIIDNSNNTILIGSFSGGFKFGSVPLFNTNPSSFVAKYDSNCNLLWIKEIKGCLFFTNNKIVLNNLGEIIICGTSTGNLIFGSQNVSTNGLYDGFLAKVNTSNGNCIWLQRFGGSGIDHATSLTKDNNDNYYVVGKIEGITSIGSTSSTIGSSSTNNLVILKFSDLGIFISSVLVVNSGNIIDITIFDTPNSNDISVGVTGYLTGNATFGSFLLTATSTNYIYTCFIAQYSFNSNSWSWAKTIGGDNSQGLRIISKNQTYYLVGINSNTFTIQTSCGIKTITPPVVCSLSPNFFICNFNFGNVGWLNTITNIIYDRGVFLDVDSMQNLYVLGTSGPGSNGKTKFDDISISTEGLSDTFICKMGVNTGNFLWAEKFGGGNNDNINAGGFTRDSNNFLHLVGGFTKRMMIGSNNLTTDPAFGYNGYTSALFKATFFKE